MFQSEVKINGVSQESKTLPLALAMLIIWLDESELLLELKIHGLWRQSNIRPVALVIIWLYESGLKNNLKKNQIYGP